MPTTLITGANRGLGLEFCRQYAAEGWRVLACCRAPSAELTELGRQSPQVTLHTLDVADIGSVDRLATELAKEAIDLLINNAGRGPVEAKFGAIDYDDWAATLKVNVIGPMKVTEALIDLVLAGEMKKVAIITSLMGAVTAVRDASDSGMYAYRCSKSGANMVTKLLAVELAAKGVCVAGMHPGWVSTDMGGPAAPVNPVTSVTGMRKVFASLTTADTGGLWTYDGKVLAT